MVWDTFIPKVPPVDQPESRAREIHHAASICGDSVLQGVSNLCDDPAAQPKVKKGVKKLICKFDPKAPFQGPALALNSGTLEAAYSWDTANSLDETQKWMGDNLK